MSSKNDVPAKRTTDDGPADGPALDDDCSGSLRDRRVGRRTFVKGLGVAGATAAGLSYENGPVQESEAIVPLVGYAVGAAAISAIGGMGLGWSLREYEIIGSDPPAEGLTGDVLLQQVYQTVKTRASTNGSTITDNQNILDGVEHTAYTDAKVAAIEELNAGSTESAVLDAATSAIDSYESTVKRNFLKTWNESMRELHNMTRLANDHPDVTMYQAFHFSFDDSTHPNPPAQTTRDITLPDGTTFTLERYDWGISDHEALFDPITRDTNGNTEEVTVKYDGDTIVYLDRTVWMPIYTEMDTVFQNVRNGISTWVTSVYGDVQSGSIEISDLVTPRERATMMSEDEGTSQAIADLIALNVPVDLEREATITIDDTGATLSGTFGLTDETDGPIETGTQYDPSTFAGTVYFTADMSLVEGPWNAIQSGIDGGVITITAEPYEGTAIEVETTAGETVSVPAADWTAGSTSGEWTYDASADLETTITEVKTARFHATATETQYDTLQLKGPFTVDKLVNTETGEEETSSTFSSSEPQDDTNYITQEEWDSLEQQNQELIDKYEDSQSNGGGLDLGGLDMFGIPGEIVALGAAAVAALMASK
ncbi:twin-arginine translocation signal domain-containing protein [Haloarcula sp. AONF1]